MAFPVLRHQRDTKINRFSWGFGIDLLPFENNFTGILWLGAEDDLRQFCAPGSHQSAKPQHLAGVDLEVHILVSVAVYMLQFQHNVVLVDAWLSRRILLRHLTAYHHPDQLIDRCLRCDQRSDVLSVSDDFDSVGQSENLFQSVGNVNDRYAFLTQQFHDLEHALDFIGRQRRAGLIHDQNLRVLLDGFGDFYHLLIANGKILDQFFRIDLDLKLLERFGRFFFHGFLVYDHPLADRSAQKEVLGSGQFSDIIEFLVNNCDTVLRGKLRCHPVEFLTVDLDFARSRDDSSRTAFDQCRFPRAVLSDEPQNFPSSELERHILEGHDPRIFFPDVFQFQNIIFTHTVTSCIFYFMPALILSTLSAVICITARNTFCDSRVSDRIIANIAVHAFAVSSSDPSNPIMPLAG